jgi:hypothetical protein
MHVADIVAELPRDYVDPEGREWYMAAYDAWATAAEGAGAHFDESTFDYTMMLTGDLNEDVTAMAIRAGDRWYALVRNGSMVGLMFNSTEPREHLPEREADARAEASQ